MRFAFGQSFLKSGLAKAGVAFAAATGLLAATPAYADASATVASDVVTAVEKAETEKPQTGDPRFRELFAQWSALDNGGPQEFALPSQPSTMLDGPIASGPVVATPSRHPLSNASVGRVSSNFGWRRHPVLGKRKRHHGIDIAAPSGTPVYATADGVVEKAYYSRSYGRVIYLDHGADFETRYAHLSGMTVAPGARVRKGDLIGFVGSSGRSTGPHLHYEIRIAGQPVNPMPYMRESATLASFQAPATIAPPEAATGRARPGQLGKAAK
ncbi:MAG: M23 family metallopeptidase [Pseudomonadota bacterium]